MKIKRVDHKMNNENQKLLNELEKKVRSFIPNPEYPHDKFIIITLHEAIAAAKKGNFGVGAVLIHENGEIIQRGHNHVFNPYFRSDLHAEMVVMTRFEERFKKNENLNELTLFCSLEPCPMCFVRLIISGVKKVYYASTDEYGGMVHRLRDIPNEWKELAKRQEFALARCSPELREIALQIFLSNVYENDRKLQNR